MKKQELFNNVTEGSPYQRQPKQMGLYNAAYEHDACGVGMLVNIHGEKSHDIVESALKVFLYPKKDGTAQDCYFCRKMRKTRQPF